MIHLLRVQLLFLSLVFANTSFAQSPKKYYKNGYYEQAFVDASKKQNKKVKLKKKHAQIIKDSYAKMYMKHSEYIIASETTWEQSFNQLVLHVKYRNMVKHPLILEKLNDILIDPNIHNRLVSKFNSENTVSLDLASNYESVANYEKALEMYKNIASRHAQAQQINSIKDKLIIIDHASKIKELNQKMGDQYIMQAKENIALMTQPAAIKAIDLIELARRLRPLSLEEEELKNLANLIISDSWMAEAKRLVGTGTKPNARLAYDLINRVRNKRTLNAEEEALLKTAESIGTTRVLVKIVGPNSFNNSTQVSGDLNKKSSSRWISFYSKPTAPYTMDFELELNENKPVVVEGKTRKQVTQNSKQVEYYEYEVNASGDSVKVKKTKTVIAMVLISSKDKYSSIDWSINVKKLSDNKIVFSEAKQSKIELIHEFASLESGDILALPENIETEVNLDSQPFPSNEEMIRQVKDLYISDLHRLAIEKKILGFE